MPRYDSFLITPAPESEDDLEVPGQPFLGLLGILSEYYKYKEPNHKQGQALSNALRYLYRVKKPDVNGAIDENFGLEIMNAVNEVTKKTVSTTPCPTSSQGEPTSNAQLTELRAPAAPKDTHSDAHTVTHSDAHAVTHSDTHAVTHSDTHAVTHSDTHAVTHSDSFSDFGFSSSDASSDELGSKIDDLVRMVKNTVKKKKKRKHSPSCKDTEDESIPKLKIRFARSGSEDNMSESAELTAADSPMKLKIKLGNTTSSPLLPPPPLLTLHQPIGPTAPLSPKYEKLQKEEKPPIKLTLRVAQPMRSAKGWISPRTEQIVNYIDNVSAFISESKEVSAPVASDDIPEPPKLKLAPASPAKMAIVSKSETNLSCKLRILPELNSTKIEECRKRKRISSPKHDTPLIVEAKVPPLKLPRALSARKTSSSSTTRTSDMSSSSSNATLTSTQRAKKRKNLSPAGNKSYWDCGIFSNTLKKNSPVSQFDELDFRSNILPIYCGINYLRKQSNFTLPCDLVLAKEKNCLPKRLPPPPDALSELQSVLRGKTLDRLTECSYVFDQHIDDLPKGGKKRRGSKKKVVKKARSPAPTADYLSSPCESPGLVIQSDCDSPLVMQDVDPLQTNGSLDSSSHKELPSEVSRETFQTIVKLPDSPEKDSVVENRPQECQLPSSDSIQQAVHSIAGPTIDSHETSEHSAVDSSQLSALTEKGCPATAGLCTNKPEEVRTEHIKSSPSEEVSKYTEEDLKDAAPVVGVSDTVSFDQDKNSILEQPRHTIHI